MASLPDIPVLVGTWTNVHTASGITVGSPLYVQNKTSTPILLYVGGATPPDSSGMVIAGSDFNLWLVTPGTNNYLWCKSFNTATGVLGVQE